MDDLRPEIRAAAVAPDMALKDYAPLLWRTRRFMFSLLPQKTITWLARANASFNAFFRRSRRQA